MTGPQQPRRPRRDDPLTDTDIDIHVEFEVRTADGAEGRRLGLEQARAFQEVNAWLTARKRSETGQDRAA